MIVKMFRSIQGSRAILQACWNEIVLDRKDIIGKMKGVSVKEI